MKPVFACLIAAALMFGWQAPATAATMPFPKVKIASDVPVVSLTTFALYDEPNDFFLAANDPFTVQVTGFIVADGTATPFSDFDLFIQGVVEGRLQEALFEPDQATFLYAVTNDPLDLFDDFAITTLSFPLGTFDDASEALAPDSPLSTGFLFPDLDVLSGTQIPLPPGLILLITGCGLLGLVRRCRRVP